MSPLEWGLYVDLRGQNTCDPRQQPERGNMKKKLLALACAAFVGACGGGGGDAPTTPPAAAPSAEGTWSDSDTGILVTRNGELWAVDVEGSNLVLYNGTITTSGNNFSATLTAYLGTQSATGTASGTFTPGTGLSGSATVGGTSAPFTATSFPGYSAAPSLSSLAGAYTLNTGGTVDITSAGAISGAPNGCTISGTLAVDSSGKNFYRVSVTFGPPPCALAGATATGVAVPTSGTELVVGIVSGSAGQALVLTKN